MADDRAMASVTRKKASKAGEKKAKAKKAGQTKIAAKMTAQQTAKKTKFATKKKKVSRTPPNLEVDPEVLEFIDAIDRYKKSHNRPFPSYSEILYVLRKLGYTKS